MTFAATMKSTNIIGFLNSILFIVLSITFNQSVLHFAVAAKKEVFNPGDELNSLNSTSYLVSASGNFTLGFFTIPSSTNLTYLGITYRCNYINVNGSRLWVANRDKPMIGNGVLVMDDLGSLKVINGNGTTLFTIFNNQVDSGKNTNTRAVLEDSGNFVVYDVTDNRSLWQSFDYPTDTLLPGMKIGYNLTTGQNWTLTSWLSDLVPATGAFTMKLEQYENSPQLLVYRRGEVYRASGPWKDGTSEFLHSFIPYSFPHNNLNRSLTFDASGMYFTYQAMDYMIRLAPDGQFYDTYSPYSPIHDSHFCNGYKSIFYGIYDAGCTVSAVPSCRGQRDSFQLISGDWSDDSSTYDHNSSISLTDCMERCWNECNCVGFTTSNSNGTGCRIWRKQEYVEFLQDPFGTHPQKYVLVSLKPPIIKRWMLIVFPLASVLVSILAIYLCYLCYVRIRRRRREEEEKRRRDDFIHQLTGSDSFNYGDELEKDIKDAPNVKIFSLKAILTATNNFSNENKLGQGGYGPVYKGILPDGREIAVKKLSKTSGQGIGEFKNELILITKLQHTNLVRLYGCCIHQEEKMLVYEFMPNKSLDFFLFVDDKNEKIDWQIRFNIIEGVAQGMLYLHKYSRMKVIHRDLKVSNVLLDENMNPKISDFGMARIFQHNVTEAVTNRVVGTYGYMAPEYAMEGSFSIKSDVFSFGVLILEIVSGKKNSTFYILDRPLNLIGYAWELWKRQGALELKDETLGESFDVKQLLRAIHVGLLCVQEDADDRPTMSEIISMLNNEIADLPNPKKPAFFTGRQVVEVGSPGTRSTDYLLDEIIPVSVNGLTITTLEVR